MSHRSEKPCIKKICTAPAFCPSRERLEVFFSSGKTIVPTQARHHTTAEGQLKKASVLIALVYDLRQCQIILTLRQRGLSQHANQVAFPGGQPEASDTDPLSTALRETHEEIGLEPDAVKHIHQLPDYMTYSGYRVTPFTGLVNAHHLSSLTPQPEEVSDIFTIPLSHALNPARYLSREVRIKEESRTFYALDFEPYYIWGATAGMLANFRYWLWQNLKQPGC